MSERNFKELLKAQWAKGKFVCVGLDSDEEKIPESIGKNLFSERILTFNKRIIDATADIAGMYKPNKAFYEALGPEGFGVLRQTIRYIHEVAPEIPVILDAKYGDIDNTNKGYVKSIFDFYGADAVTIHPYMGEKSLESFLNCKDKGIIVLCRTSNKGADEFQKRLTELDSEERKLIGEQGLSDLVTQWGVKSFVGGASFETNRSMLPLYLLNAFRVSRYWNKNDNCCLVVGATNPADELAKVRRIIGDMPILIPGIGAQGGDLENAIKAGKDYKGQGMIINSSRGIIFASSGEDFAGAARREAERLSEEIKKHLQPQPKEVYA